MRKLIHLKGHLWEASNIIPMKVDETFTAESGQDDDYYSKRCWVPEGSLGRLRELVQTLNGHVAGTLDVDQYLAKGFEDLALSKRPSDIRNCATDFEKELLTFVEQYDSLLKGNTTELPRRESYGAKLQVPGPKTFSLNITPSSRSKRTYLDTIGAKLQLAVTGTAQNPVIADDFIISFPRTCIISTPRSDYSARNLFEESKYGTVQLVQESDTKGLFRPKPNIDGLVVQLHSQDSEVVDGMYCSQAHLGTNALNKLLNHMGLRYRG